MTKKNFQWPVRIYYEDTDSGGVVYHAGYLRFMERARTEWLRSMSIEQQDLIKQYNILFAVTSLSIDFIKPAVFNDLLIVESSVNKMRRASIIFRQKIKRDSDNVLLTDAEVKIACVSASKDNKRAVAIPDTVYDKLTNLI